MNNDAFLFGLIVLCGSFPAHSETDPSLGQTLYQTTCLTCHQPPGHTNARITPPMHAVKRHYLKDQPAGHTAIQQMSAFLQQPNEASSQMSGAIQRFGLMPDLGLTATEATAVAGYVIHTDLGQSGRHGRLSHQPMTSTKVSEAAFELTGKSHALAAKSELGRNLMQAIGQNGTAAAVSFCHEQAMPLTQQVAKARGVSIKRVSDQPRNPANQALGDELTYISQAKAQIANGHPPDPLVMAADDHLTAYYPITTNTMCLQCHGEQDTDIKADTLRQLRGLYPTDQATGYASNQLRGIWVISQSLTSDQSAESTATNDKRN